MLLQYHIARLQDAWIHFASLANGELAPDLKERIRDHVHTSCDSLEKTCDWRVRVNFGSSVDLGLMYHLDPSPPSFPIGGCQGRNLPHAFRFS